MMDPVSLALLTALGAGVTSGLTDATKDALVAGYTTLKDRLLARFGQSHPDLEHAITTVEAKPSSQARQDVLVEELTAARVANDPELVALAHTLLYQLQLTPHGSQVIQHVQNSAVSQFGNATTYNIQGDQHHTHA
jgi:hypothetical protein